MCCARGSLLLNQASDNDIDHSVRHVMSFELTCGTLQQRQWSLATSHRSKSASQSALTPWSSCRLRHYLVDEFQISMRGDMAMLLRRMLVTKTYTTRLCGVWRCVAAEATSENDSQPETATTGDLETRGFGRIRCVVGC